MNNELSPNLGVCSRIAQLRRASGMTQDALAEKLGVTFQAVSKWENALSCPDIALLPRIAEIFGVSIDSLFGIDKKSENRRAADIPAVPAVSSALPWEDDGKLRAVLFIGTSHVGHKEYNKEKMDITFRYEGEALDIASNFSISCNGDIKGNAAAGYGSITCEGDIGGEVATGNGNIACDGDICGEVATGNGNIACDGDICGNVSTSNGDIECGDVQGSITVKNNTKEVKIDCGDVGGTITLGMGTIDCGDVDGDIKVETGTVDCGDVGGNISANKGTVDCGDVDGDVIADKGSVTCGSVDGSVTAQTVNWKSSSEG